jgi:hypothetical protein
MRRLIVLVLALGGCATGYRAGVRAFDHGLYAEALATLQEVEAAHASLGPRDRARYALYRGLTHLALGDRDSATAWLERAKDATLNDPWLLSEDDLGRLDAAWAHVPNGPVLAPAECASAHP